MRAACFLPKKSLPPGGKGVAARRRMRGATCFLIISILSQRYAADFLIISILTQMKLPLITAASRQSFPPGGSLKRSCNKKPSPCLLKILHCKIFFDKNGKSFLTSSLPLGGKVAAIKKPSPWGEGVAARRRMRGAACFLIISI